MDELFAKEDAEFSKVVDAALAAPNPNLSDIENGPNFREKGLVFYISRKFVLCWVVYTYQDLQLIYIGMDDPGRVPSYLAKRQISVPVDRRLKGQILRSHVQDILNG